MDKEIIYIGLEFIFGPIQKIKQDTNGNEITGVKVIDEDKEVQKLDKEISDLWCSLWENDPNETRGMRFDKEGEKKLAPKLLDLINQLKDRLETINDGSYELEDIITERLKSLIKA